MAGRCGEHGSFGGQPAGRSVRLGIFSEAHLSGQFLCQPDTRMPQPQPHHDCHECLATLGGGCKGDSTCHNDAHHTRCRGSRVRLPSRGNGAPQTCAPTSHPRRHITEYFKGERGHPFRMFKTELKRVAQNYLTDNISVYTRQPNRIAPPPVHMFGAPGKVRDGNIPDGQAAMGAPNKHTDTPPPAPYRRQPLAARAAGPERARTGTTESFFSFLV